MLADLYSKPLRVYLLVAVLAGFGVLAGLRLPISLYPNVTQPRVGVSIGYGNLSPEEFRKTYGRGLEGELRSFRGDGLEVEKLEANYRSSNAELTLTFKWGQDGSKAQEEIASRVSSKSSPWPEDIRDSVSVWQRGDQGGFLAISFFSEERSVSDLHSQLRDALEPRLSGIPDKGSHWLQNPESRRVKVTLDPAKLLAAGATVSAVESTLEGAVRGLRAGNLVLGDSTLSIEVPPQVRDLADFESLTVPLPGGKVIPLDQIATVSFERFGDDEIFKTSGRRSLILYATPKPGGNIKQMGEDIMEAVNASLAVLPADVTMKVLVDPSAFIRSSVSHVIREILIGAGLASAILFLFIGSFRNVATAAIEIPISLVLAFILMEMTGMSLNLISLGGLALSAGMNVDASVVVMENIFRRLEEWKGSFDERNRIQVVIAAVKEVWAPVVSSTIASLVVFVPLLFTDNLAQAVLGDLAKAVVFSHGFSCFVALILVPTVRLHLMRGSDHFEPPRSPIENFWVRSEGAFARAVGAFARRPAAVFVSLGLAIVAVVVAVMVIVPRLPKEVVGLPESDFVVVRLNENGVFSQEQKEEFADGVDEQIAAALGDKLDYTFLQISKWGTTNLVRLKSRKDLDQVITILEGVLKDTPEMKYRIQPWNPSELPIPNPPQLQIQLTGGTPAEQAATGAEVRDWLEGTNLYPRVYSDVSLNPGAQVLVWRPRPELVTPLGDQVFMNAIRFLNLSTGERTVADWASGKEIHPVQMGVNKSILTSVADLRAIPLRIGDRIVPLSALGNVDLEAAPAPIFAVNGEQTISIYARQPKGQEALGRALVPQAEKDFQRFRRDRDSGSADSVRVEFVEAEKELSAAISEITQALGWSLGLIGLILLLQFGKIGEVFLVLVAVPLGVVGSFLSLWIFGSTLSLNSVLGIIMMNGLAVGNSIILVDFMNRLSEQGLPPLEAAVQAARTRLRPILITSLTTILGMTPIALGFGEGGKILQPLGISVAGGLWFSMVLTLFLVPALHVCLLQWRENRRQRKRPPMSGIGQSAVNHFLFALVLFPCAALMVTGVAKAAVASTGDRDKLLVWMRSAIDASPEARVRLAEQEVSRLRRDGVGGVWKDFLPSLGADGQLVRRRESSAPLPVVSPRGAGGSTVAGVGISARSNLFAGGRDQALRDEAEAALETDQAGVLSSRLAAAERLGGLVLDYLELRQREAALADRAELLQRTHKVASLRFAKAQIARSDVARVLRQMELAQGEAEDLDLALAAIRRQITIASPLLFPESVEVLVPIELLPDSPAALKQGEQHPEVVALVAQQRALAARRSAINSGSFPTIDGVLAANTSYPLDPSGASEEYGSSAALELTWTFYDKGKRSNESAALLAQERVVEEQIKRLETKQGTARDVAVSGLKRSLARHKRSLTLIETAQDALQAQQERFSQGRVSLFELLSDTLEVWKLEDGRREQNTAAQRAWLAFCRSAALELDTCIKVGK